MKENVLRKGDLPVVIVGIRFRIRLQLAYYVLIFISRAIHTHVYNLLGKSSVFAGPCSSSLDPSPPSVWIACVLHAYLSHYTFFSLVITDEVYQMKQVMQHP